MRLRFPRETYVPKGAVKVASKKSPAVAYLGSVAGRPLAVGFYGKADKPAFNYSFRSTERRDQYVANWLRSMDGVAASKAARVAARAAKMAAPMGLKVGDVLYGSWGYDQTNVEFWQVVKIVGKRMVEIRELCTESVETGFMSGNAVPLQDQFTSKQPLRKKVDENDCVKLYDFGCYLSKREPIKVDGVPVGYRSSSWTSYA